jgi:tape measure domain-containing protein
MADNTLGIFLSLDNVSTFMQQASETTAILDKIGQAADSAVAKLNKIQLGSVSFEIKGLDKLNPNELTEKAAAVVKLGDAYKKLMDSVKGANPSVIADINAAIGSGARKDTIQGKADGLTIMATALSALTKVKGLDTTANSLKILFGALSTKFDTSAYSQLPQVATNIEALSKGLSKLGGKNVTAAITSLQPLSTAITTLSNLPFDTVTSKLPAFSDAMAQFSKAIRSFTLGKNIADLPMVIQTSINALEALINIVTRLNSASGNLRLTDFATQLSAASAAILSFSKAMMSFGKYATEFQQVGTSVAVAINAFKQLQGALNVNFAQTALAGVGVLSKALVDLAAGFKGLSRIKGLTDLPVTIQNINTAFASLNTQVIADLGTRLQTVAGPLKDFADSARALNQLGKLNITSLKEQATSVGQSFNIADTILKGFFATVRAGISVITTVAPIFANIATVLAKFSFTAIVAGFQALKAVFITLPFQAVSHGFNLIVGAINLLIGAVKLLFSPFFAVRDMLVSIARQQALNARAFSVLIQPIQFLIGVLQAFVAVVGGVISIGSKLANVFNPFKKSTEEIAASATKASETVKRFNTEVGSSKASSSNVDGLDKSLKNVQQSASNASTGMHSFNQSVNVSNLEGAVNTLGRLAVTMKSLEVVGGVVGNIFNRFAEQIKGTAVQGFEAVKSYELLHTNISVLLGKEALGANPELFPNILAGADAMKEKATELLNTFGRLAIESPFERDDIAQGFKLAQVYGFNTDAAVRLTNAVTDVAAAYGLAGTDIKEIILPLGQIQTLGRAQLQDAKQLAQRGIPVFEYWANALGTTTAKVQELISAGLISSDFAIQTIVEGLERDFTGAAKLATGTWAGLMSTFEDARKEVNRALFTPILDELKPLVAGFLSFDAIQASIAGATERGQKFAAIFAGFVVPAIQSTVATFKLIPAPITNTIGLFIKFAALTAGIAAALGVATLAAGAFAVAMGVIYSPVFVIAGAISAATILIVSNFDTIMRVAGALVESISRVPTAINNAFSGISTGGENPFAAILEPFSNLSDIGSAIAAPFIYAFDIIKGEAQNFVSVFSGIFSSIGAQFSGDGLFAGFIASFTSLPQTISDVAGQVITSVGGLLNAFVEFGANIIGSFSEGIVATYSLLTDAIVGIGDILTFWLSPGSPPRVAPELDKWGAAAAFEFVNGFLSTFQTGLRMVFDNISMLFRDGFGPTGQAILEPFAKIGAVAVTLLAGSIASAAGLIVNTVSGIIQIFYALSTGIGNQIGIIIDAIIKIVEILDTPTKAFTNFQNIVMVVADAIVASMSNMATTLSGVFNGLLTILGGVIAFINSEYLTAFIAMSHVSETIRGSLDTIAAGARDFLGGVQSALESASNGFLSTLENVVSYGANLVYQFAQGIIDAASYVADALAYIGDIISYWLAPGSPPKIAPDIDKWGTSAAEEFLGGFTDADLDAISEFGSTVEEILKNTEITGVDIKDVAQSFATGLESLRTTGDFGAENFQAIVDQSGEAGTEVAKVVDAYIKLNTEQNKLTQVTNTYNEELAKTKGLLESAYNTDAIDANVAKIESLQNAMNNTLLTQEERTNIQRQIEKIQAETRIKQLEEQKNAQEKNVESAQATIDLQKQQLKLASEFDSTGTNALTGDGSSGSDADKAAKAKKVKLPKEDKLNKKEQLLADFGDKLNSVQGSLQGLDSSTGGVVSNMQNKFADLKKSAFDSFENIRTSINNTISTIKTFVSDWIVNNNLVRASLLGIGTVLASLKLVSFFTGLRASLALLATPLGSFTVLVVGLGAAFSYFAVQSGGVANALKRIQSAFTAFTEGFKSGITSPISFLESQFDLTSIEGFATSVGASLGRAATEIKTAISNFTSGISTGQIALDLGTLLGAQLGISFADGSFASNLLKLIQTSFNALLIGIGNIFSGIGGLITNAGQIATTINDVFLQPIVDGFEGNDTVLTKITGAISNVFGKIGPIISNAFGSMFSGGDGGNITTQIDSFFTENDIAAAFERNINAVVNQIMPSLAGDFDFSNALGGIATTIQSISATISDAWSNFTAIFEGDNILTNLLKENQAAFNEFITEVSDPAFISALGTIGTAIGVVVGALAGITAGLIDVAILGILRNIADLAIDVAAGINRMVEGFKQIIFQGDIWGGSVNVLLGLLDIFNGIVDNISNAVADFVLGLLRVVGVDTTGWIEELVRWITYLTGQFLAGNIALKFISKGVALFNAALKILKFEKIVAGLTGVWKLVKGISLTPLVNAFKTLGSVFVKTASMSGSFLLALGKILLAIGKFSGSVIIRTFELIGSALAKINIMPFLKAIADISIAVGKFTGNALIKALELIGSALAKINIMPFLNAIKEIGVAVSKFSGNLLIKALGEIGIALKNIGIEVGKFTLNLIVKAFESLWTAVKNINFTALVTGIRNFGIEVGKFTLNLLVKAFESLATAVKSVNFTAIGTGIKNIALAIKDFTFGTFAKGFEVIGNAISKAWEAIKNFKAGMFGFALPVWGVQDYELSDLYNFSFTIQDVTNKLKSFIPDLSTLVTPINYLLTDIFGFDFTLQDITDKLKSFIPDLKTIITTAHFVLTDIFGFDITLQEFVTLLKSFVPDLSTIITPISLAISDFLVLALHCKMLQTN